MTRFPKARRRPPPRGVSLVEMLIVVSIGSAVLALCVSGFDALLRLDRRLSTGGGPGPPPRLIEALRDDAHAATRLAWDAEAATLTLALADGTRLRYALVGDRCERRYRDAPAPDAVHRLPGGATLSVDPATAAGPALVGLTFSFPDPNDPSLRHETPVAIALGRDATLLGGFDTP